MTKIEIPNPPSPVGNYTAYKIVNNLIYISGQLPIDKNGEMIKGTIGKNLTLEDGKKAARLCILNSIGQLKNAIKDLDKVIQCVKMNGYINCTSEFIDHPKLLNSASDFSADRFEPCPCGGSCVGGQPGQIQSDRVPVQRQASRLHRERSRIPRRRNIAGDGSDPGEAPRL